MAVKKHKLDADHQKQIDLIALAKYLQLLNEQQNYIPQAPEMMQNCQDILKCLARTSGTEEQLWQLLQPVEEFLLRVVRNADCVIAILDKFYAYISDPQSVIYPPIADVLVVIEGADEESILMAAKWVVKQRKDEPSGTNHTVALSRLYLWLCNWHGTPALGNWILAYIKALEESQRFDILIDASLEQVGSLFLALGHMVVFHRGYVSVILHVLESLRESAEAFDKISPHIERVLENLASDSEQWSRELLQKLVDILTAMVDCISNRNTATEQIQFRNRYAIVLNCLELHISSRTSSFLPPWRVNRDDATIVPCSTRAPPMIKVGLVNLGNTCYMNSVLQALFAARKFSVHVMMNLHVGGYWAKIGELFAKMMFGKSPSVPPIDLYDAIKMSAFSGNQQHDSSEFLSHLFNRLRASEHTAKDNDNNNCNGNGSDSSDSEQTKQHAFASGSRKRHNDGAESGPLRRRFKANSQSMLRNTFVEEMFGGAQLARVECSHCQNCVVSRDVFCELHLSFPEKLMDKTHSVQSLLEFYCTTERMTGDNRFLCTECGELRDADRSVRIDHYPIHLVLVLKNFEYDVKNSVHTKLMHNVVCDLNIVMPALRSQKKGSYNLFAAVIHNGINIDSGHYYTVAKNDTWMFQICMVVAFAAAVTTAPVEEPIKIDLPVYERPNDEPSYLAEPPNDEPSYALAEQPNARPSYTLAGPLQLENHPGENPSSNSLYDNLIGNKIDALDKKLNGPFARIKTLERAVEETEGYGSKILSVKENLGNAAAGIFKPKPIVDIIEEEDKYGNTGDKFYNVGRAIVNGSSKVSTYVNTLLEIPGKFVQQISRIASEKLNNVGAKIVGL